MYHIYSKIFRKHFPDSLENGKVVRLIFQGQLLRDDSRTLASYGICDQCAVHCHVGNRPYQQQQAYRSTSGQSILTMRRLGRDDQNINTLDLEPDHDTIGNIMTILLHFLIVLFF